MMDEKGEMEAFTRALDRFSEKADRLLNTGNMNTAKIEVNAGGIGVWLCLVACAVVVAVTLLGSIYMIDKMNTLDSQLKDVSKQMREKDDIHDAWIQTINNNKQDKEK